MLNNEPLVASDTTFRFDTAENDLSGVEHFMILKNVELVMNEVSGNVEQIAQLRTSLRVRNDGCASNGNILSCHFEGSVPIG